MIKNNSVVFKGGKTGIVIQLSETADFQVIRAVLADKLKDAEAFFGEEETPVTFAGRALSETEEADLLRIIGEHTRLQIVRPKDEPPAPPPPAAVPAMPMPAANESDHMTTFHHGGLRSGQSIRTEGSVVVTGDVNPGAEIIAGRNIIVLGMLRGKAYAGQNGDAASFIAAMALEPIQLRICDCITTLPPEPRRARGRARALNPVYAYVDDGKIHIAPLMS